MLILSIISLLKNLISSCFTRRNKNMISSEFPNGLTPIQTVGNEKNNLPKTGNITFDLKFKFFLF